MVPEICYTRDTQHELADFISYIFENMYDVVGINIMKETPVPNDQQAGHKGWTHLGAAKMHPAFGKKMPLLGTCCPL
jgi:hypothetical protein